jgi:hypothetical protein
MSENKLIAACRNEIQRFCRGCYFNSNKQSTIKEVYKMANVGLKEKIAVKFSNTLTGRTFRYLLEFVRYS